MGWITLLVFIFIIVFGIYGGAKMFAETELRDGSLSFRETVHRAIELKSQNNLRPETMRAPGGRNASFFETYIDLLYRFSMRR